jgi:hypothetical protein
VRNRISRSGSIKKGSYEDGLKGDDLSLQGCLGDHIANGKLGAYILKPVVKLSFDCGFIYDNALVTSKVILVDILDSPRIRISLRPQTAFVVSLLFIP